MRRGFTLLEAIVAMAIIAAVSVGALGAFGADLRAAERAQRTLPAAALARERLATLEEAVTGPLNSLPDSMARGGFAPPFEEYAWTATAKRLRERIDMIELSVVVSWSTGSFTLGERRYQPATVPAWP